MAGIHIEASRPDPKASLWFATRLILLIAALVFFAVHGSFSFQGSGSESSASSSLSGLTAAPRSGFIAYGLLPGLAYSIVVGCIIFHSRAVWRLAVQMNLLTALALLTILSAAWSQNPSRSAIFGTFYLLNTFFAYYLVAAFSPEQIRKLLMYTGVVIALSSAFVVLALPKYGLTHVARDLGSWRGIFIDRTSCAKCLVFLFSAAVTFRPPARRLPQIAYALLIGIMMVKAHSVTALLVFGIWACCMAFLALHDRLEARTAVLFTFSTALLAVIAVFAAVYVLPVLLHAVGKDITFSGRTAVWAVVLHSIWKSPILGYGFYSFWQGMHGESANAIIMLHWAFGYAHNGILEIALQLGLVGVILFFLTLLQAIRNAWVCLRAGLLPEVHWFVSLLILSCLYNVDEATVVWPNELLSILYVVACCGLAQASRNVKHNQSSVTFLEGRAFHEPDLSPVG